MATAPTMAREYPFEMEERFSAPGRLVSRRRRPRIAGSSKNESRDTVPGQFCDGDATSRASRNAPSRFGPSRAAQSGVRRAAPLHLITPNI